MMFSDLPAAIYRKETHCNQHVLIMLLSMLEQCKMTWSDGVSVISCPNFFWNSDNNNNNNFSLLVPTSAHITLIYTPPNLAATCFGWSCTVVSVTDPMRNVS